MNAVPERPRVCILHTGRAVPQMLLGADVTRSGGAELQLAEIARQLACRGWPVTFAFYSWGGSIEHDSMDGIRLLSVPPPRGFLPGARFLTGTLPSTWRLITEADADIYLQMGAGWQNGLVAWYCRGPQRRFVLWLGSISDPVCDDPHHSRLKTYERWLARRGLRQADVVVAQTRDQQQLLMERHGRRSILIRNIWTKPLTPPEPPTDPPEVFWAATMRTLKRPHLFLDVAEALPELRFVMAGGPADDEKEVYEAVRARAQSLPNVEFLGFVPFAEIDRWYRRAAVYLCTSTIEGFPNTFLQSWSHGRPVVSTFDPDGVIAEHGLGYYCTTTEELIEAVLTACRTSTEFIEPTRQYLRSYHSPEVILPQIEAVLSPDGAGTTTPHMDGKDPDGAAGEARNVSTVENERAGRGRER